MIDRAPVAAVARELGLSWDTVNSIAMDATAMIVAYFDHHASNGPTEAINGRLEALRRNALGFRNLTLYRLRSLLHCGKLTEQINAL
jgi:Transposase